MEPKKKNQLKPCKIHSSKGFLNKPFHHSDASICSEIKTYINGENKHTPSITFKIRDCYHTVQIIFDAEDKEALDNCFYKVDKMIRHLEGFKDGLERLKTKLGEYD